MNRCDFRCVLKRVNVRDRHRSTGRLFQACGLVMAKARSPMVERHVAGTRTSAVDAERSWRRESTSDNGWINSDRYCGAAPFRQRCTRTQSFYWMRSGMCSQCRFTSSGVTWSNLRASAVSRAATFSTDWIQSRSHCSNPARATLQLLILDVMNDVTNVNSALRRSEWQMQRICLRTLKHELTSRVRWASIDMSLLKMTQRSWTLSTDATEMEPTCQLVGWKLVSPSRRCAPHELSFCSIQLESVSGRPAGYGAHTVTKITTEWCRTAWMTDSVELGVIGILVYVETMSFNERVTSAVYMMNRIGPNTEPCGTRNSTTDDGELLPWCTTCCRLDAETNTSGTTRARCCPSRMMSATDAAKWRGVVHRIERRRQIE